MANYANQITIQNITIDKIKHKEGINEQYLQWIKWDCLTACMNLLSGNEFKLYMYLLKWSGQTYYNFSPVDIYRQLGFKRDTARSARRKLEEYGFLIKESKNAYSFDPFPDKIIEKARRAYLERVNETITES